MIKMRPYVPSNRIAVRDSIDEEISDDVDDDVFIKDARTAKLSEEKGLKRPLMAPRRKNGKLHNSVPIMMKHRRCWRCCEPFCYGLAALTVLIALISLAALILTMFPIPLQRIKVWLKRDPTAAEGVDYAALSGGAVQSLTYGSSMGTEFVPCTQISVQRIWTQTFPRMNSESPVRKADLDGDDVEDIIFGFGVDDNIQYEGFTLPKCKSAQGGDEVPCEGGVIAINGATGNLLWQTWSVANVFSLLCTLDIDRDGHPDCVAAGRLGMIFAINGRNGNNIWEFREVEVETNSPIVMDLYTINIVRDLDGDEISEILAAHLEEREESKAGHIKIISGKTGKVIRTIPTPFKEEVFVPLQVLTKEDGTELLMITTGGQNTPGGVYTIRLLSLMQFTSEKEFTPLFQSKHTGVMVPAVITDITGDQISDIVVSSFNSTVFAFDGHNSSMLWNYTFPASESVSTIVPGHFNHDNVTDFMVKYNTGPGFPVYYYSQTTILDGRNGKPLLDAMMTDSGGSNSLLGGVSVSQTFGGDFYLHWQMQCRNKYDAKDAYEFIPDSDIILQSRADTCRLRYNTSTVLKLYAIARHIEPPGAVIFSTDDIDVHLNHTQRPQYAKQNSKSPLKHPKLLKKLLANRDELLKKIAAGANLEKLEQEAKFETAANYKGNPLRSSLFDQNSLQEMLPNNEIPAENIYEPAKQNGYANYYAGGYGANGNVPLRELQKAYESETGARVPEDYDALYADNDNEVPLSVPQNEHPIRLRTKYPGNRDVRSDITSFEDEQNATQTVPTGGVPQNSLEKQEPLSLWDLEMEKEERDAIKESHKYDYSSTRDDAIKKSKRGRPTRDDTAQAQVAEDAETTSGSPTTGAGESDEWFLASISSTGVLLKSLNGTRSSIDFAFVVNIRESETYPPLFLPQDLNCVEEKISAYKSYTLDNLRILRKQFLKQCLSDRLVNVTPHVPQYESQLIVTRIGISCTCRTLQAGEVCSELDDIQTQRWTEYMGNGGHGYYAN
ncbi:uncharacterized protein LOC118743867 [Rhagoletis pomonella]|uniref:uncharacterized protein LOC118743867 n=1 Tax=Rhagoletis pomonella TaxID=28610 RepID=UPI00177F7D19|nr:uncharacterized protein LOC118743867 [Rhagoletis pomonella]